MTSMTEKKMNDLPHVHMQNRNSDFNKSSNEATKIVLDTRNILTQGNLESQMSIENRVSIKSGASSVRSPKGNEFQPDHIFSGPRQIKTQTTAQTINDDDEQMKKDNNSVLLWN